MTAPADDARRQRARAALRQASWFGVVGVGAALTHAAVFGLTRRWLLPEVANAVGFMVGFWVSFAGHRWLSFADTTTPLLASLRRFGVAALAGFFTNEATFFALHRLAGWPAWPSLVAAVVVAAAQSFVLGRFWAFKR